ncbi:MAG: hypothetical protein IMZ66_07610 [Planctomycetes bacterium]|nr:hypothetical protein [Planctomycetota bacterium]
MSWLRRHAAWIWPASLITGLILVALVRLWSGWAGKPETSMGAQVHGVVTADSDDLAAVARRIRTLQEERSRTREQFTALVSRAADCRQHVAALDEMLASGRLTDCPVFLREETTVRALQKIIREAAGSGIASQPDENQLSTAGVVARQRLRAKLGVLRDQLHAETATLETRTEALKRELDLQATQIEALQAKVLERLESRMRGPSAPAA